MTPPPGPAPALFDTQVEPAIAGLQTPAGLTKELATGAALEAKVLGLVLNGPPEAIEPVKLTVPEVLAKLITSAYAKDADAASTAPRTANLPICPMRAS